MLLSAEEKIFIVENNKVYNNFTILMRKFRAYFKKKESPSRRTVQNIINKFRETGSVENRPSSGRKISVTTEEKIEEVRVLLKNNPGMSIRRTAVASDVSNFSVFKIAHSILNLYPYKIKILHKLKDIDYVKRLKFAKWFLSVKNIEDFFIATDEAYFHLNGLVNNHNFRIWSDKNPDLTIEKAQKDKKVLIWCAVSKNRIVGPFYFEKTVNGENYLNMLKFYFWPRFYRQKNSTSYYFQQDGAPAHRKKEVQDWLEAKFGDRFINKDLWPPRSPDLNPCDFFLWGFLKDRVYARMPKSIDQLKNFIEEEIKKINSIMLSNVFENLEKRCNDCISNKGGHIE